MLKRHRQAEDGGITVLALFIFITVCALLGIALDVANAYRLRTRLQLASDAGGHAALYERADKLASATMAKQAGVNVAASNLGENALNSVVRVEDVVFGDWNPATRTFTPRADSKAAVRVTATRSDSRRNPVSTMLLNFVGLDYWNISTHTVLETYKPGCLHEGFISEGILDIQGNNTFGPLFCLHSNTWVSINSNNIFKPTSIVSMPNLDQLDIPDSGFESNDGLREALREGTYNIRILSRIMPILNGITSNTRYVPPYIQNTSIQRIDGGNLSVTNFTAGGIYNLSCQRVNGQSKQQLSKVSISVDNSPSKPDSILDQVVVIANCPVEFGAGVELHDVVFINTSTDSQSFSAPSGLQVGKNDSCASGGGAQLLTLGGMDFPANLALFGGQLIAVGDVSFAARADGIMGASIISGGEINGTSNANMGHCPHTGMEGNFELDYFRIVE